MIPLSCCDDSIVVFIETQYRDWTFLYDIVKTVRIGMSVQPHSHPIPYGTEITDHVNRLQDQITITGVLGCLSCDGIREGENDAVAEYKRLIERMMYCKDDYVTLTSNCWAAKYMILTRVDIEEDQDRVQTKMITTTWQAANLTGTIRNPNFERGGIVH